MRDIDYGCNADNPLDAITVMLDSAPQAMMVVEQLEALGFQIVRSEDNCKMAEALRDCLALIEDMSRFVGHMSLKDYALFNEAPIKARAALKG